MEIIEHSGAPALVSFIDEILRAPLQPWAVARVKKNYLRQTTNEAFMLAVTPILSDTDSVHVFFVDSKRIYVVWKSQKKSIYRHLRSFVANSLSQPGLNIDPSVLVAYIDPVRKGESLKIALRADEDSAEDLFEAVENFPVPADINEEENRSSEEAGSAPSLMATSAQTEQFRQACGEKPYRRQLQLLVVEDQIFSQKIMCDVLRGARTRNNNETPLIDVTDSMHEAWKIFLKKAPDVTFVDLGLIDGSGHTLARAMKELDPSSCVIIVTANNYEEELSVAKQNNVDGFISKPYNKKQILDCIERYMSGLRSHTKGASRGLSRQF